VPHPDPVPQPLPPRSCIILGDHGCIYLLDPQTNILRRIAPTGEVTTLGTPTRPVR